MLFCIQICYSYREKLSTMELTTNNEKHVMHKMVCIYEQTSNTKSSNNTFQYVKLVTTISDE